MGAAMRRAAATPLPQSAWVVNAQGATQLATNAVQFVLDYDAGFGFVLGPTGELELLDQHAGATPIMLEPGGTAAPVTIAGAGSASRPSNGEEGEIRTLFTGAGMPGHAQPGIGGQFVWYGIGGGESDYEFGARQRYALSYIVGGTSRPGVYIYDTVGGTFSGPN